MKSESVMAKFLSALVSRTEATCWEKLNLCLKSEAFSRACSEGLLDNCFVTDPKGNVSRPLELATRRGFTSVVQKLLALGASPVLQAKVSTGNTPMHMAILHGDLTMTKHMTAAVKSVNGNIDSPNYNGDTALMFAVHRAVQEAHADLSHIVHLIETGASISCCNRSGLSAAMISCSLPASDLCRLMLQLSSQAEVRKAVSNCDVYGNSALHIAARAGSLAVCNELIERGACPFQINNASESALEVAKRENNPQVVHFLHRARKQVIEKTEKRAEQLYHEALGDIALRTLDPGTCKGAERLPWYLLNTDTQSLLSSTLDLKRASQSGSGACDNPRVVGGGASRPPPNAIEDDSAMRGCQSFVSLPSAMDPVHGSETIITVPLNPCGSDAFYTTSESANSPLSYETGTNSETLSVPVDPAALNIYASDFEHAGAAASTAMGVSGYHATVEVSGHKGSAFQRGGFNSTALSPGSSRQHWTSVTMDDVFAQDAGAHLPTGTPAADASDTAAAADARESDSFAYCNNSLYRDGSLVDSVDDEAWGVARGIPWQGSRHIANARAPQPVHPRQPVEHTKRVAAVLMAKRHGAESYRVSRGRSAGKDKGARSSGNSPVYEQPLSSIPFSQGEDSEWSGQHEDTCFMSPLSRTPNALSQQAGPASFAIHGDLISFSSALSGSRKSSKHISPVPNVLGSPGIPSGSSKLGGGSQSWDPVGSGQVLHVCAAVEGAPLPSPAPAMLSHAPQHPEASSARPCPSLPGDAVDRVNPLNIAECDSSADSREAIVSRQCNVNLDLVPAEASDGVHSVACIPGGYCRSGGGISSSKLNSVEAYGDHSVDCDAPASTPCCARDPTGIRPFTKAESDPLNRHSTIDTPLQSHSQPHTPSLANDTFLLRRGFTEEPGETTRKVSTNKAAESKSDSLHSASGKSLLVSLKHAASNLAQNRGKHHTSLQSELSHFSQFSHDAFDLPSGKHFREATPSPGPQPGQKVPNLRLNANLKSDAPDTGTPCVSEMYPYPADCESASRGLVAAQIAQLNKQASKSSNHDSHALSGPRSSKVASGSAFSQAFEHFSKLQGQAGTSKPTPVPSPPPENNAFHPVLTQSPFSDDHVSELCAGLRPSSLSQIASLPAVAGTPEHAPCQLRSYFSSELPTDRSSQRRDLLHNMDALLWKQSMIKMHMSSLKEYAYNGRSFSEGAGGVAGNDNSRKIPAGLSLSSTQSSSSSHNGNCLICPDPEQSSDSYVSDVNDMVDEFGEAGLEASESGPASVAGCSTEPPHLVSGRCRFSRSPPEAISPAKLYQSSVIRRHSVSGAGQSLWNSMPSRQAGVGFGLDYSPNIRRLRTDMHKCYSSQAPCEQGCNRWRYSGSSNNSAALQAPQHLSEEYPAPCSTGGRPEDCFSSARIDLNHIWCSHQPGFQAVASPHRSSLPDGFLSLVDTQGAYDGPAASTMKELGLETRHLLGNGLCELSKEQLDRLEDIHYKQLELIAQAKVRRYRSMRNQLSHQNMNP